MPWACDSTNWAMCARTSARGEPAKISLCRLRTDSIENGPDSSFAGPSEATTSVGDWIALSITCPFLALLDSASRFLVQKRREYGQRQRWHGRSSAVSAG